MSVQAELAAAGHVVSLGQLCVWLGVPRRSVYYRCKGRRSVVDRDKAAQVKAVIERFGLPRDIWTPS